MPFSSAMVGSGGPRVINLANLDAEDLAALYVVETQIALQFPAIAPSRTGDVIRLTVEGFTFVAALANNYCIDADGLDDEARFELTLEAGCFLHGRGGKGGRGGSAFFEIAPGSPGLDGGTAIRLGCPTVILGIGTIQQGYGGGGGGAGVDIPGPNISVGGSGGGGGASLGVGGAVGSGEDGDGAPGVVATVLLGGAGGQGPFATKDGGDGGSFGIPAAPGEFSGGASGGIGGSDGDSIDTQGFTHPVDPGITIIGAVI